MSQFLIQRRLRDVSRRLQRRRADLAALEEELAHFVEAAEDARIRALVSETPLAGREHAEAQKHADAMARSRDAAAASIAELERAQDELLERLAPQSR